MEFRSVQNICIATVKSLRKAASLYNVFQYCKIILISQTGILQTGIILYNLLIYFKREFINWWKGSEYYVNIQNKFVR